MKAFTDSNDVVRFLYSEKDLSIVLRAMKIYREHVIEYEPPDINEKLEAIDAIVAQLISPGQ